jgi:4-amino-4-deoxychorismate lyase
MRRLILEDLTAVTGLSPVIKSLALEDLQKADELFICNSLAGILPVASVSFSPSLAISYSPGPVTRQLQSALEQIVADPTLVHPRHFPG